MYFLETVQEKIRKELAWPSAAFSFPPNPQLGDLSLACFDRAAKEKKSPAVLALEMAEKINDSSALKAYFQEAKAVGPYVNFFFSSERLSGAVLSSVKKEKEHYGQSRAGRGQKVMIEYSNANTHKEYHVGHLRNISFGDAVAKLLAASHYKVIPVSYINDFGIHVAKTIWAWQRKLTSLEAAGDKGYYLGRCYVAASQELEKNPEKKGEVTSVMKEIESRGGENYRLWQETRRWSIDYFGKIYKELGVRFSQTFYESEVIDEGKKLVEQLLEKGILKKSQGAVIADLSEYDLGVLPIVRSDGTALYPVADLSLAREKFRRYHLDASLYVVDIRQSLYFRQLFKILELAGYQERLEHLAYDFVTLPGGMMSSRTGQVITYEDLKNRLSEKLISETRQRHPDWTESRVAMVSRFLAISTIKFELLKVSADKTITFNIEEAARFEGYTACYLQYGYARLRSIIRKGGSSLFAGRPDFSRLKHEKERTLSLEIAKYPAVIALASERRDPSELAKYLFNLVQLSNDYYHEVNILKAPRGLKRARLALIGGLSRVIKNSFEILGLQVLEEM